MKVYYLCNLDLGWDNVVCISTSRMKCIEEYTDGEVILKTDKEVDDYLELNREYYIGYRFLCD